MFSARTFAPMFVRARSNQVAFMQICADDKKFAPRCEIPLECVFFANVSRLDYGVASFD